MSMPCWSVRRAVVVWQPMILQCSWDVGLGMEGHSLCASVGRWNACAADQNNAQTAHFKHALVM